jgi:hypothetical protein
MTSHPAPQAAPGVGRVPLIRSFAFRLGVAFAAVAIAAAGITALVVNAAFAARFDRYLAQQQHTQLTRLTAAASHAYAGNGKWDLTGLKALPPAAGPVAIRILTPSGQRVWQWDGHSMSWDNRWMQATGGSKNTSGSKNSGSKTGGGSSGGQPGTGHDNWGSWDHGWMSGMAAPARSPSTAVLLAAASTAATPAASPSASPSAPGPVQRVPIIVNGKVVGTALVRLPPVSALPAAVAFRGEVDALLLAAGAAGALVSLALGSFSPAARPGPCVSSPGPPRCWRPVAMRPA